MAFSLNNNIITQTGTDNNLAGLGNITGVTTLLRGGKTLYNLGTRKLSVAGNLSYNAVTQALVFAPNATEFELTINAGARLFADGRVTLGTETFSSHTDAIIFGRVGITTFQPSERTIENNGILELNGVSVDADTVQNITGTFLPTDVIYRNRGFEPRNFRLNSTNHQVDGLRLENANLTIITEPQTLNGVALVNSQITWVGLSANTPQAPRIYADYSSIGQTPGFSSFTNAFYAELQDYADWDGIRMGKNNNNPFYLRFTKAINITYKTLAGSNIEGATLFVPDNNNGSRDAAYPADEPVLAVTDAQGNATGRRLIFIARQPVNGGGDATLSAPIIDARNPDNDTTGNEAVYLLAYEYLTLRAPVNLKGNGEFVTEYTATVDINITLSDAAAGALTTITTADELYDAAKYWKTRPIQTNLEYPTIDTQPIAGAGSLLDLGTQTLVMDDTAPVFNAAAGTITVNATTIAAGAKFNTIRATEVVGDLDGVDVEGTWRTQLPVTLTGRNITKLIVDGGTGDISLTNCEIGEIENQSGTDASLFLIGTPVPTLTETNGALTAATGITFNDAAGGDFTLLVINPADNSVVRAYDPTPAGTYIVDAGARSQLRIAAYKRGHYTLVRTFDISGDATFPLVFTAVPFVDMDEDVSAIKNDLTTSVITNPYPGIDALVRSTFASPHPELSQNQFKRVFVDFQGREDMMGLLAEFNLGGSDIFTSTSTGVDILRAVVQFAVAGDFEVNTLAFVDSTAAVALTSAYIWNPENTSNRKVIGAPVPILLQSNLGLDDSSGGGGATAQEIWSFPTRTLTSGGGSGGVTLAEIEASTVLAKEASVLSRPTLADMEASAALTAVADVSSLVTLTEAEIINEGIKKASLMIPHNTNL